MRAFAGLSGNQTPLRAGDVFPSLADVPEAPRANEDLETEDELLQSFEQMRTVIAAASGLPLGSPK